MKDIEFLYDDSHLEKQELEKIARQANKEPVKKDFNAVILRKFTLALINAVAKKQAKSAEIAKQEMQPKKQLLNEEIPHPELKKELEKPIEEKKIPVSPVEAPKPEFPMYDVIKNFEGKAMASVMIKEHTYFLKEQEVNDRDKELLKKLVEKLESRILKKPELVNDRNFMVRMVQKYCRKLKLQFSLDYFDKIRYYFVRNTIGYSLIDPLIQDSHVREIHFIGLHKPLKIAFNDEKDIETNIIIEDMQDVNKIIKKFFDKSRQKLTRDSNYIDNDVLGFQVKAFYDFTLKESKFDIKK